MNLPNEFTCFIFLDKFKEVKAFKLKKPNIMMQLKLIKRAVFINKVQTQ